MIFSGVVWEADVAPRPVGVFLRVAAEGLLFILIRIVESAVEFSIHFTGVIGTKPVMNRTREESSFGVKVSRHKGRFVSMELTSVLQTGLLFRLTTISSSDAVLSARLKHRQQSSDLDQDRHKHLAVPDVVLN